MYIVLFGPILSIKLITDDLDQPLYFRIYTNPKNALKICRQTHDLTFI